MPDLNPVISGYVSIFLFLFTWYTPCHQHLCGSGEIAEILSDCLLLKFLHYSYLPYLLKSIEEIYKLHGFKFFL